MSNLKSCTVVTLAGAVLLLAACTNRTERETYQKKYGAVTVSSASEYKSLVKEDSNRALVDLRLYVPDAVFEIRYATDDNFMGRPVYSRPGAFLRRPAAEALRAVQSELADAGYGLKIWDAYRPYRVTVEFYERVQDSTFAASPYTGSKHNRGCAIDLTLIDKVTGKELAMPTEYDAFVREAHAEFSDLPEDVLRNRTLLIRAMAKHGFTVYADEWWHFDFNDWEKYPLMDLEFDEVELAND